MKIVSFTPQDQEATAAFMKNIAREMGWPDAPEESYNMENFFHLPEDGFLLLVKNNGKIAGTAGCIKLNENDVLLKRFYIATDLRGSGIAQKLFDRLLTEAKKFQGKRVVIDVSKKNPRAIRFYKKNGFKQYSQKPIDEWSETRRPDIFNFFCVLLFILIFCNPSRFLR